MLLKVKSADIADLKPKKEYLQKKYLFRTSSFNIIWKKIFVRHFPFLIMDSLKFPYPL